MSKILRMKIVAVLMLFTSMTWAQDRTVTGRVTSSEDGAALSGVNVVVKGSTAGTVTDANGNYSMSVPAGGASLVFSFIGMKTLEIEVGQRTIIDAQLAIDVTQLSEVVVTALGLEANKDQLGYTTSKVGGNAVTRSGEATLINGLSGKASGVLIARATGDPGAGSYIQIRGQSSITSSVQPLIVIDGVPVFNSNVGSTTGGVTQQSRLNDLNANDIESYEVLKGASASALWGSRASNGVIMITTKKGASEKGKINISYSGSYSMDQILFKHPYQRSYGQGISGYYYTNALGDNLFGSSTGLPYAFGDKIANRPGGDDVYVNNPLDPKYVGYFQSSDGSKVYPILTSPIDPAQPVNGGKNSKQTFDPYDAIFQTGQYFDHNLSLSGGDKSGNFYLSVGNLAQQGIVKGNSDYNRTTIKFNQEKVFNKIIKLSTNFSYSRVTSNRIQQGSNVNGLFLGGLRTSPDFNNAAAYQGTYYNAKGLGTINREVSYRNPIGRNADPVYDNPVWIMYNNRDRSEVDRFIGSFKIDVTPLDWLTLTARAGVDHYSDRRKTLFPVGSAGAVNTGSLSLQTPRETQFNGDLFGRGNFDLNSDVKLIALLGINFNQRTADNVGGTTQAFTLTNPPLNLNNSTATNRVPFNAFTQQRTAAAYATADFSFRDQFFMGMTGRYEAASTYGRASSPMYFYPSANAAWQFSKTLALQNSIFSFGKLRVGYGQVAVQPGPYNTATYFGGSVYGESWGSTLDASAGTYGGGYEQSSTLGNSKLKPEIKTEIEFGGDFRFFNDRVNLGVTYFSNDVKGVILPVSLAGSTGFTNKTANAASLHNSGIEVELGGDVYRAGDFRWNLYGNWTRIRNKVADLAGTSSLFLAGFTGTSSRAVLNQPVGVLWGVDFLRDDTGKLVLNANGFPQQAPQESVIGNPNPDWRAGLGSTFSYKNFSLNVLFERQQGGDIWAGTKSIMMNFGTHEETNREVTLSAADAATLKNYNGVTIANYGGATSFGFPYHPNPDGSYTIRGYVKDFGGGPVVIDESWWTSLGGGFGPVSTHFIQKATWTRLGELSLTYSLRSDGFRKATKLSSVDFSITGRNLFVWTGFQGNDPETNLTGPSNGRGLDYFNNPGTKSYVFTIKINY